ncbi:Salicylic acid-binding protein 2, partial [Mucuna pruriens]
EENERTKKEERRLREKTKKNKAHACEIGRWTWSCFGYIGPLDVHLASLWTLKSFGYLSWQFISLPINPFVDQVFLWDAEVLWTLNILWMLEPLDDSWYNERTPSTEWLDTEFYPCGKKTSMFFGPKFLSNKLYQLSSVEDLELAKSLARPSSLFMDDLSKQKNFSKEGYGSVPRAYIVCTKDFAIPLEYQLWMIHNAGFNDVVEIKGADHMAMLCQPQQLFVSLQQIATKYA